MHDFLIKAWYGEKTDDSPSAPKLALWYLFPLNGIYFLIVMLRKLFFKLGLFKQIKHAVPVIVVGNITVGGTGKTPMVIALVDYFKQKKIKSVVVSRGYGGKSSAYPLDVDESVSATQCGDEAKLLRERLGIPVIVDPDRNAAVKYAIKKYASEIVISDDGLQHLALGRDKEIVLIDSSRGLGNGHLLPSGPLREPANKLNNAKFVVLNGLEDPPNLSKSVKNKAFRMSLQNRPLRQLVSNNNEKTLKSGETVHAVAGIGNPDRFFASLKELGFSIIPHEFPDHHEFCSEDLSFLDGLPIVMTEKDGVKVNSFANESMWVLPVEAMLEDVFYERLMAGLGLS